VVVDEGMARLQGPVVFRGSLANADGIVRESLWEPGAYCNTSVFFSFAWYPAASRWLLHERWKVLPPAGFDFRRPLLHDPCGEPPAPMKTLTAVIT
jgi:hypothetical protein